jgi:hypothetical protein
MIIISSNPSNQFPYWMSEGWKISTVDSVGANLGVVAPDTLDFMSSATTTTNVTPPQLWGTLDPSTVSSTAISVAGVTSSNEPFHIDCNGGQLICRMDPLPVARWGRAVAWGATLGGVLGGVLSVVGMLTGVPLLGALAVPVASAAASLFTAVIIKNTLTPSSRTGSGATWVAEEGGAGLVQDSPRSAPQALKAVRA